jgi:hypothetical protein
MNDKDLERMLRTQRGPREEGYVAGELPSSLDARTSGRRPSPLMRAAVILPAAAAGVLVVAAAGAMISGLGPFGSGNPTPTPQSGSASPGAPVACGVEDLSVDAEPWTGAAGSRGTVVSISLAEGRTPCSVASDVYGRISDAAGSVLVSSKPLLFTANSFLVGRTTYTVGVAWSNWCAAPPLGPIQLQLRPASISSWVVVFAADDGADPVPPCLGEEQPSNLSLTELQPAP